MGRGAGRGRGVQYRGSCDIAALAIGIMAGTKLGAILALSSLVVTLARDFMAHRKAATVPEFQIRAHPSMAKGVEADIRA